MPFVLPSANSDGMCIGFYKPRRPYTTDQLLNYVTKISKGFQDSGCVKFAILRTRKDDGLGHVAICTVWETKQRADSSLSTVSRIHAFEKAVSPVADTVDMNWYETSCMQCKEGISVWQLSKGDIVHLRCILSEPERQEVLSYSCLAILRAYFPKIEGLLSCGFCKCLDGRKIVGLGVWESAEAANAFKASPGEPYWKGLGAKLRFGVYEVAHVTEHSTTLTQR
eukprot:c17028_g1_i3 orf=687-1358(+)